MHTTVHRTGRSQSPYKPPAPARTQQFYTRLQATNPPTRSPHPLQGTQPFNTHLTPIFMHPTPLYAHYTRQHTPSLQNHTTHLHLPNPLKHPNPPAFSLPSYTPPTPASTHPTDPIPLTPYTHPTSGRRKKLAPPICKSYTDLQASNPRPAPHTSSARSLPYLTRLTPVCTHPTLLNAPYTRLHAPHPT
jgi:hypothetical protein